MEITVRTFYEEGKELLQLGIEAGEAFLDNPISEISLNRPGLALAGFYQYFAQKRIQVIGLAESSYLKSMTSTERSRQLALMFKKKIPALVVTRNRRAPKDLCALSTQYRIPVLRSGMITGHFMNEATLLIERLTAPSMRLHGTMVDIMGVGVLIEGPPGIGKSEAALALIERGHSLVADDITVLRKDSDRAIVASSVEVTRYHMEIRGLGIIHVPSLFGVASMRRDTKLDLIVRLKRASVDDENDRSGLTPSFREVFGLSVPLLTLPVAAGRDLAHVIEVAARNQKLKDLGHDAAKELDEKLIAMLTRKRQTR